MPREGNGEAGANIDAEVSVEMWLADMDEAADGAALGVSRWTLLGAAPLEDVGKELLGSAVGRAANWLSRKPEFIARLEAEQIAKAAGPGAGPCRSKLSL